MRRVDRVRTWLLGIWSGLALLYLFIPIFIIILFSFNDNKGRFNLTWEGFTLRHWKDPLSDPDLADAFKNSLIIAGVTVVIATLLGTFIAIALVRYGFRGRATMDNFIFLPLATPEVVLGAALLALFLTMNFSTGMVTIVIAHVMFSISYVVVTVRARLQGMDRFIEEAAMDLGANEWTTFRKITLPMIAPGVAAAALLVAALSIDDYVITSFNAGTTVTFPLYIFGASQRGIPVEVYSVATLLFAVTVLAMIFVTWQQRRAERLAEVRPEDESGLSAIASGKEPVSPAGSAA